MKKPTTILFLGETYRADAQTWIRGIEQVSGITIDTLEVEPTKSRSARLLKFVAFWIKILVGNFTRSYDLVLAERATSYGFFSLFVRAKKRIVAQQGITDAWPETGFSGKYKRYLQSLVYRNVDLIHAWGQVMVPAMLASGARPDKIMILPKGMDLSVYKFVPLGNKNLHHAIVTRSLTPVYHHRDILQSVFLLKERGILLQLTLIGDGDLRMDLEETAKSLGIASQVEFAGRIPNVKLPDWLQKAAIYVSVPETEGVSASLFEAMASGCFPIVTDLEGTRCFIHDGENGFLVPVNSPEKLADAIGNFLKEASKFEETVANNRRFIEENADIRINMSQIWSRYIHVFNSEG